MEEIMFGLVGGESERTLARLKGYRIDAQKRWPTLTHFDLSQIKTEEQLTVKIGERYSLSHEEAGAEVHEWMKAKTF
jgi:hypothetical protein